MAQESLTQKSLTAPRRTHAWIDEAFLWTAGSLAVVAIAAAFPAPGAWPGDRHASRRAAAFRPALRPRIAAPSPPAALIAFGEPAPGYPVISPFGIRQLPWEEAGRLHKGVDIAAPEGTPVLAAADGVVVRTGVDPGYGRFVELQHAAGLTTLYGHLDGFAPEVRPGAAIRQGQRLGPMGSTGSSTGSHVHFEVHDAQGRPLNPELFIGRSFQTAADLPLKQALRLPRGLRVAFVSVIPYAKEAQLLEHEDEEAAQAEAAQQARAALEARARAVALARGEATLTSLADAAVAAPAAPQPTLRPMAGAASTSPAPETVPTAGGQRVSGRIDPGG